MKYKTKQGVLSTEDIQFKSLKATLNRLNCRPEEVLAWITTGDWQKLGLPAPTIISNDGKGGQHERPAITVEVRQKAAAELMSYMHPKLKAIEHSGELKAVAEQRLTADEIKSILVDDPFLKAKEIVIDERTRDNTPIEEVRRDTSGAVGASKSSSEA